MKSIIRPLLAGVALSGLLSAAEASTTWDVTNYGAIADSQTVNTTAIQAAVAATHLAGGGQVIVPPGAFVTGTILLQDNVTLYLAEGAQLLGSANPLDYLNIAPFVDATGQTRGKCLIGAVDASNIAITGQGTIDGRGGNRSPSPVAAFRPTPFAKLQMRSTTTRIQFLQPLTGLRTLCASHHDSHDRQCAFRNHHSRRPPRTPLRECLRPRVLP